MKKSLLSLALLSLAFFNISCDNDDKDDQVIPAMELAMQRSFMYHDTHETKEADYTTEDFQTAFVIENDKVTIYMAGQPDEIAFEIEANDLTDGYVGVYPLKSLPDNAVGKAKTTYMYDNNDGSGSAYFSQANFIEGALHITSYNKAHNLITGTFEMSMEDVPDPTATSPNPVPRRCDVTLSGEFKNAKLTVAP